MWYNFRCRKCNNLISINPGDVEIKSTGTIVGDHQCPNGEEGEETFCDLISTSSKALENVFEIFSCNIDDSFEEEE